MKESSWRARQGMIGLALAYLVYGALGGYVLLQSTGAQQPAIVYKPPLRGAPGGREGAGSRGFGAPLPALIVLTPRNHTGLTVQEQPVLYWYVSQETKYPVEVTLIDRQKGIKPLLEVLLAPPLLPGIHRVRLADYGVRLAPGDIYKWSVALVPNSTERSQDIVSAGTIIYTAPSEELRRQMAQVDTATAARLYAANGFWYDTIAALSDLIDSAPQDTTWRQQRAALLEQEQLVEAAAYDRKHQ